MVDKGLFAKEEGIIAAARARLEEGGFADGTDRADFADLLKSYEKLFKITKRFMRLSDRNERALNAMAERERVASQSLAQKNRELETLSLKLSKYLSPQVYASIFSGAQKVELASQRKKLTVFFSDIMGFTETTDMMESEDLTGLINRYLTEMSAVALAHGATIDKYIGDGIMIFFGDPESRGVKEDALACVRMAIAMQKRLQDLAAEWRAEGIERPLSARMGIHTGYCTVGNFGSADRMDYTIIGGTVNLASRLEDQAEAGGILISYETFALVRDEIHCEEVGRIATKGLAYPVATYRAIDLIDAMSERDREHRVALPHLELAANFALMGDTEREQAALALGKALALLGESTATAPEPAPQTRSAATAESATPDPAPSAIARS